jgi:hypothetical protein
MKVWEKAEISETIGALSAFSGRWTTFLACDAQHFHIAEAATTQSTHK